MTLKILSIKIYKILFMIAIFLIINDIANGTKIDEYAFYYCSAVPYINKFFIFIYIYIILFDKK